MSENKTALAELCWRVWERVRRVVGAGAVLDLVRLARAAATTGSGLVGDGLGLGALGVGLGTCGLLTGVVAGAARSGVSLFASAIIC